MTDERIDFSPFTDALDDARVRRAVGAVMADASVDEPTSISAHLARWPIPGAIAASLVTALIVLPSMTGTPARRETPTIAEILGVPAAVIELSRSKEAPDVAVLAAALNIDDRHAH